MFAGCRVVCLPVTSPARTFLRRSGLLGSLMLKDSLRLIFMYSLLTPPDAAYMAHSTSAEAKATSPPGTSGKAICSPSEKSWRALSLQCDDGLLFECTPHTADCVIDAFGMSADAQMAHNVLCMLFSLKTTLMELGSCRPDCQVMLLLTAMRCGVHCALPVGTCPFKGL